MQSESSHAADECLSCPLAVLLHCIREPANQPMGVSLAYCGMRRIAAIHTRLSKLYAPKALEDPMAMPQLLAFNELPIIEEATCV